MRKRDRVQEELKSKYCTDEQRDFIQIEIARGRSTEEIRNELIKRWPHFGMLNELTLNHIIGGNRMSLVQNKLAIRREQAASVENHEERIEEREKKFFKKVFENNERIELIKERALEFYEAHPEKIRPKDYKDLSVAQAIGTRDLREYKQRRAGRLDSYSAEELEIVKVKMLEIIMRKKNGEKVDLADTAENSADDVINVEGEVIDESLPEAE